MEETGIWIKRLSPFQFYALRTLTLGMEKRKISTNDLFEDMIKIGYKKKDISRSYISQEIKKMVEWKLIGTVGNKPKYCYILPEKYDLIKSIIGAIFEMEILWRK